MPACLSRADPEGRPTGLPQPSENWYVATRTSIISALIWTPRKRHRILRLCCFRSTSNRPFSRVWLPHLEIPCKRQSLGLCRSLSSASRIWWWLVKKTSTRISLSHSRQKSCRAKRWLPPHSARRNSHRQWWTSTSSPKTSSTAAAATTMRRPMT